MEPVRFGVLGARSRIARGAVVPAIDAAAGASLVAVGSRTGSVPDDLAHLDAGSYEGVLAHPEVEAVYLPLPNGLHAEWAIRAAEAGKHVLCEKPLARNAPEARRMADACHAAGVLLAEAWMTPFNPEWDAAVRGAESGALGEVRSVRGEFTFTIPPGSEADFRWDPADGGGALLDVGIYATGAALALWGPEPATVAAAVHRTARGVDATVEVLLACEGGRTATAQCSFELPERQRLELVGTEGRLTIDGTPFTGTGVTAYLGMVQAFADAVRGLRPWPRPVAESVALAVLMDRILEAAR
jgi:D-xylose 1-dehydrogenase (NADP+, D-xylono-1,5-lactone-forming)